MLEMIYKSTCNPERKLLDSGEYKGFNYYIISLGWYPCAYVEIPRGHSAYEVFYTEYPVSDIDCHGGITYAEKALKLPHETLDYGWFIGWDYSHSTDYSGLVNVIIEGKKWKTEEILSEVHNVIDQLLKM